MTAKVWFITGCSSGFGAGIARNALKQGDKVIATARNPSKLADLKADGADTMALDVTATLPELKTKAEEALKLYGRIDYLVNNAGTSSNSSLLHKLIFSRIQPSWLLRRTHSSRNPSSIRHQRLRPAQRDPRLPPIHASSPFRRHRQPVFSRRMGTPGRCWTLLCLQIHSHRHQRISERGAR